MSDEMTDESTDETPTREYATEPRPVRKLRHWKQRFTKDAEFRWRKNVTWKGEEFLAGSKIREDVLEDIGGAKVRRFWQAHLIELWGFEEPNVATGLVDPPTEDLQLLIDDERWTSDEVEAVRLALQADTDLTLSEILEHLNTDPLQGLVESDEWSDEAVEWVRQALLGEDDLSLEEVLEYLEHEDVVADLTPAEDPSPGDELPAGVTVSEPNKGWYTLTIDGEETKIRGLEALNEKLAELRGSTDA